MARLMRGGWFTRLSRTGAALALPALVLTGGAGGSPVAWAAGHAARTGAASWPAGTITTVAGGVGGPAPARTVTLAGGQVCGVTASADGGLYVSDSTMVREISPQDWLTTPVGSGAGNGGFGDGDLARFVRLGNVCGTAVDAAGNLVLADAAANDIRVVAASTGTFYGQAMTAGHIYPVAGDGTATELDGPQSVVVDSHGNLVIADSNDGEIRVLAAVTGTFYGQAMTQGGMYTIASTAGFWAPGAVAIDGYGNVLVADTDHNQIAVIAAATGTFYGQAMTAGDAYVIAGSGQLGYSGDGGPAAAAEFFQPHSVTVDAQGNVVVADSGNSRIRVVAEKTGTFYGQAMTVGDVYTVAGDGTWGFAGAGGPAAAAELNYPLGVAVDSAGDLLIADNVSQRVLIVPASTGTRYGLAMTAGDIYSIAGVGKQEASGDAGPAIRAVFRLLEGVATDAYGNTVLVSGNAVRVVAASTGRFYRRAMTDGDIYGVAGTGQQGFSGDGGPAVKATFYRPQDAAVTPAGDLAISDAGNDRVRLVAARTGTFFGQAMTKGDIYTIAGDGSFASSCASGPAIGYPFGVAADPSGNVLIADYDDNCVRVVAAKTGTFYGRAMTAGGIYKIAGGGAAGFSGDGGPAEQAHLDGPEGVALDRSGNVIIVDTLNRRVRVVAERTGTFYGQAMTRGDIYTVAGTGTLGSLGDGGPATAAALADPQSVAVDGAGNLIIADTYHNRVRVVAASTGTFYGQAMTAGDIYTIAGDYLFGYGGDAGPGTSAELYWPTGVAVTPSGDVLIADSENNRIRMVTP